jgi:hypothetical protein
LLITLLALGSSVMCAFAAKAINDYPLAYLESEVFRNSVIGNVIETIVTDSVVFIAALFPSIWFWLYAGSGFLLKAARRLDVGFKWASKRFDIEKKPLQSIGLVAGALVAMVYWAAVIVSRIIPHARPQTVFTAYVSPATASVRAFCSRLSCRTHPENARQPNGPSVRNFRGGDR